MTPALPKPGLTHVCDLTVALDPILSLGAGRAGDRRIIPIVGGTAQGPHLSGRIKALGADWQTLWDSGVAELDARYVLETIDGALIDIRNYGYRHGPDEVMAALARGEEIDPARYYMRTQARLETGDPRYEWVNRTLFVGTGQRLAQQVVIALFKIG